MSWKFVFNTNLKFAGGTDFEKVRAFTAIIGYKFFIFNGDVYDIQGNNTGIKVEDLF